MYSRIDDTRPARIHGNFPESFEQSFSVFVGE
jgi:hypothetical protein